LAIYQRPYLSNYLLFFITTCFIGSTIHYFLPILMSFYLPQLLYSCFVYLFLRVSVALSQLSPSSFTELLTDYLPVNPFYIGSSKTLSLRSVIQGNEDESTTNEIHMPYQRFKVAQQHARLYYVMHLNRTVHKIFVQRCDTVQLGRNLQMFLFTLRTKLVGFSETSPNFYQPRWLHIPGSHSCEN
jgi:hypothetical protein